jgi:hypothetical protein
MTPTEFTKINPVHYSMKVIFFPASTPLVVTAPCKTNTLTILMHQMRILITQFSSVMLLSKKLEIRKNVKTERAVG